MFTRTSAGLANEHLFYGVEYVVYCEGQTGQGDIASLDELYWSSVFSQFGKNIKCKSSGSKPQLESLAKDIISNKVSNVIVAMDRDYSDLLGEELRHPQVIYTYGYSWESDIVLDFSISNAINLFQTVVNTSAIELDFSQFRNEQSRKLIRAYALDYKYFRHPNALFNRLKPSSIVSICSEEGPSINVARLLSSAKLMGKFQSGSLPSTIYRSACGIRSFFGKSILRLVYRWFEFRSKGMPTKGRKCQIDTFASTLILNLNLSDLGVARNHYYHQHLSVL